MIDLTTMLMTLNILAAAFICYAIIDEAIYSRTHAHSTARGRAPRFKHRYRTR